MPTQDLTILSNEYSNGLGPGKALITRDIFLRSFVALGGKHNGRREKSK